MNSRGYKFLIALIGVIVAATFMYLYILGRDEVDTVGTDTGTSTATSTEPSRPSSKDLLLSATILVPEGGERVALSNGRGRYVPVGSTALGGVSLDASKSLEVGEYVLAPINVESGGTGSFIYVALFRRSGDSLTYLDDSFIGDRIIVSRIVAPEFGDSESAQGVVVEYLGRGADDAMAAQPTVRMSAIFTIEDDKLVGADSTADSSLEGDVSTSSDE